MRRNTKIYIGTSGWHYKHWKGTFYPQEIKDAGQFDYYSQYFNTVEINNSFYKLPAPATFRQWKMEAPAKFIFSVKASRFITHMKKLNPDGASIQKFLRRAGELDRKLGPVLFQLPPAWNINIDRLAAFLKQLPGRQRYTFEFRNHSWYHAEVFALLRQYNCAFCIYHLDKHLSPLEVTADFVYVRLHGPGNKYQGNYPKRALEKWAGLCHQWQHEKKDVYLYFDNDQAGYAAFNAQRLLKLVNSKEGA